jgi:hypothetical protein
MNSKYGLTLYKDGTICRMKNRRMIVQELEDGDYHFTFQTIADRNAVNDFKKQKPLIEKGVKVTNRLRLTREAVNMMVSSIIHLENHKQK